MVGENKARQDLLNGRKDAVVPCGQNLLKLQPLEVTGTLPWDQSSTVPEKCVHWEVYHQRDITTKPQEEGCQGQLLGELCHQNDTTQEQGTGEICAS